MTATARLPIFTPAMGCTARWFTTTGVARIGLMLVAAVFATQGVAAPIEVSLVPVDNSAGGSDLDGFTTTDIVLTVPGRYVGSQLFIELDQGTVYQHAAGSFTPPSQGLVDLSPAVAFDTYVANGSHDGNGPFDPFSVLGAAVNLAGPGQRPLQLDEDGADVAWAAQPANPPMDVDDFMTARVTLSDDAEGRWMYLASTGTEWTVVAPDDHPILDRASPVILSRGFGVIRSGELVRVPEPGTLGLLAGAAIGLIFLTRRRG